MADLINGNQSDSLLPLVRQHDEGDGTWSMSQASHLRYWNTSTLAWEKATGSAGAISTSGGGAGGGAATIADGADVAQGTTSDVAWVSGSGTVIALLKKIASAGGSAVSVADGADVAQGATTDTSATLTVVGILKAIKTAITGTLTTTTSWASAQHIIVDTAPSTAVTGPLTDTQLRATAVPVSGTFFPGTQPVSLATNTPDVTDRAARLVGHVTIDNASIPVTGTFFQATQPVSLATNAPDVTDRAARLLGVVTASGTQARAAAITANPLLLGVRAASYPTKPTSVAAGQLVDVAADLEGVIYTRPRQVATYTSIYRAALAAATSSLTFTFTANTDKQLATIAHAHAAAATKRVVIRRVWVQIIKTGAVAGEVQLELRTLSATTAPATGNPAITPSKRDPASAGAEATCLALPTTAGSEALTNSPIASSILNLAASVGTASGTGTLPSDPMWIKLYDEASADDEEQAPVIRAGTQEGYAVVGRSTAAVPLFFIVRIVFTEE